MKRVFICLIVLLLTAVAVNGRTVGLTLHPAKAPEPAQKYRLLPKAEELSDADAVPLYEKAVENCQEMSGQTKSVSGAKLQRINCPVSKCDLLWRSTNRVCS